MDELWKPREGGQTQKVTYWMIPSVWNAQNRHTLRDKKYIAIARGWGEGVVRRDH